MKKLSVKLISAIVALSTVFQVVAGAFGGTYPEHPQYAGLKEQTSLNRDSWCETDSNYIFEVEGKKFILLDTDDDGNYFVLAEDLYGKKEFDTSYADSRSTIETATEDAEGNLTYTQGDACDVDVNQVIFSTTDETNIGYWLNNDFLTSGNGTGNILPQAIQANLIEKDWTVEGMNGAVLGWQAQQYYDDLKGQTTGADFAKSMVIEPYTVKGKVSLMSVTEFKAYQDIIGFNHNEEVWRGMSLRTPMFQLGGAKTTSKVTGKAIPQTLSFVWGNTLVKNASNKTDATQKKMILAYNDSAAKTYMYVRPCFWLSKDFFKNVKVNVDTLGSVPNAELLNNNTSEELKAMGYTDIDIAKLKGGIYSTFKEDRSDDRAFLSKTFDTESDPSRVFEVDGVKFVLLDTDEDGNYYILTEKPVERRPFDNTIASKVTLATYDATAEVPETKDDAAIAKFKEYGWKFDPQDDDNIGKWLNNEFLTQKTYWPNSIKNNLVEKTYEVEGMIGLANLSTAKQYPNQETVKALTDDVIIHPYKVTAKVVLPSYTEMKKYHDIIGYSETGWVGFMLRTPAAGLSLDNKSLIIRWGLGFKYNAARWEIFELDANSYYARPSAYINKDFFKTVKVNVDKAGDVIKEEILKNSYEDLKAAGYTDAEIAKLKNIEMSWEWGNYPASDKVFSTGESTAISGAVIGDSPSENLFTIGGRRFILLDRNLDGEYFVMADEEYGSRTIMNSAWNDSYKAMSCDERKILKQPDWLIDPKAWESGAWELNDTVWALLSKNPANGMTYREHYTGDKTMKVLPDAIADSVVEKTWNIEPATVSKSWKISSYGNGTVQSEVKSFIENFNANAETQQVTAKVMFPSVTEYNQYKNKIGFKNYNSYKDELYAGGFYTRTQIMVATCPESKEAETWTGEPSYVQIGFINEARSNIYYTNIGITNNAYMVRPVMWLKADFFKNNKIDVATAGETVFTEMRDLYTKEDLAETYTSDEIALIFGEISQLPISNVVFTSAGADIEDITKVSEITVSADFAKDKENCVMILSVYDKDGRVLNTGFTPVDMTDATETVTKTVTVKDFANAASCKVFVVDSFATLTPQFTASK